MNRSKVILIVFQLLGIGLFAQLPETLELQQAVALAIEHNFQVKLARADADIAALNNHAGEAGFLPELNLDFDANQSDQDINLTFFSGESVNQENARSQSLSGLARLEWTLFDGMRMFATRDRLNAIEEMTRQQFQWQVENTIAEVVHRYGDILVAEKMLEFNRSNLAYSRRLYEIAEDKLEKGIGNRTESLRLAADYYADSSMVIRQENDVSIQKHRFCYLLGINPTDNFELTDLPDRMMDFSLNDILENTQTGNPELLINKYRQAIAKQSIREERSAFLPTLGTYGVYQDIRQINEVGILERNFTNGFNYGLRLQWNLFDGNRNRRYVQQAHIAAQTMEWEQEDLERKVKSEAIALWKEYLSAEQIGRLEEKSNVLAEENLSLSVDRFERGIAEDIDVREARRNLTETQLRMLQAKSEQYNATAEILKLTGKGRSILE